VEEWLIDLHLDQTETLKSTKVVDAVHRAPFQRRGDVAPTIVHRGTARGGAGASGGYFIKERKKGMKVALVHQRYFHFLAA
jgi:hypothetical protein